MKKKLLCGAIGLSLILGSFTGCGDTEEISDTSNSIDDTASVVMEETDASEVPAAEPIQETLNEPVEFEETEKVLYTVSNRDIQDGINNFVNVIQSVEKKQYSFIDRCIDTLLESTAQSVNDSALLNIKESDPRIILTQDLYDKEDSELDSFIYSASDSLAFGSPWDSRILASNINHTFSYYEDTDAKIYMVVNFGTYQDFDYSVNFDDSYCYVTIDSRHTYDIKKDYIYDIVDGYVNFDYYHYFDDSGDCSNGIGNFENVMAEDYSGYRFMFNLYDFRPWYFELVCSSDDPTRWLINDVHCLFDDSFESPYDSFYINYFSGFINDCLYEKGKYYDLLASKLVNEGEPERESLETVDVPENWKQVFLNSEDFMEYSNNAIDYDYILLDITDDGVPELFLDTGWGKMILFSLGDNYTVVCQSILGLGDTVGFSENYLVSEDSMYGVSVYKINKGTSTFTYCSLDEATGEFYDPDNSENVIEWDWDSLTYIYQLGLTSTAQQPLDDAILNYNN